MISQVFIDGSKGRSNVIDRIEMSQRCFKSENHVKLKQEKLEYLANLEKEKETNAKITQEVRNVHRHHHRDYPVFTDITLDFRWLNILLRIKISVIFLRIWCKIIKYNNS